MFIVHRNYIDTAEVLGAGPGWVTSGALSAENLRSGQPSKAGRIISPLLTRHVTAALGVNQRHPLWDTVAFVALNASRHRNLFVDAATFTTLAAWVGTNVATLLLAETAPFPAYSMSALSGGVCKMVQSIPKPGKGVSSGPGVVVQRYVLDAWAAPGTTGTSGSLRLFMQNAAGTSNAAVFWDLNAGTIGSGPAVSGSFANVAASVVESIANGWKLYRLEVDADTSDDIEGWIQLGSSTFSATASTSQNIKVGAPQWRWSTADLDKRIITYEGGAAAFRVAATWAGGSPVALSDWLFQTTAEVEEDRPYLLPYFRDTELHAEQSVEVQFYDPNVPDGYSDVGRLIVGPSVELTGNVRHDGVSFGAIQPNTLQRSRGGQTYKGEEVIIPTLQVALQYLTREQALGEIHALYRTLGTARPFLAVVDEAEAELGQTFRIYGTLDEIPPIPHRVRDKWETELRITASL